MFTLKDRRARRGYSLLELLVVVVALGILVNVLMLMFTSASRLAAYNSQGLNRLATTAELGEEFTELVRQSLGVVESAGPYRTGGETLVLQLPPAGGRQRFAMLGLLRQPDRLSRMDFALETTAQAESDFFAQPPAPELTGFRTYAMPLEDVAFRTQGRRVTLELRAPEALRKKEGAPMAFHATARGILESQP